MIDIEFSPNSIIEAFKAAEESIDSADSLEKLSLPEQEDIERELESAKKEIDSFAKTITEQGKEIKSQLSSILNRDFEYKWNLYTQLLSNGLTEESFPIEEWIAEKECLEEVLSINDLKVIFKLAKNNSNEEIKNSLIYEGFNIVKACLNSTLSFKYGMGSSFIKESISLAKELDIKDFELSEKLRKSKYDKEKGSYKVNSQANYWKIYDLLKNIDENQKIIIEEISSIEKEEIKAFVYFLEKTDFLFSRNYSNRIEGFKKDNLRNTLFIAEDKHLRESFYPEFIKCMAIIQEKTYLSKEKKEDFSYVLQELEKGLHYLTLSNKLDKKMIETKKHKI